MPNHLGVDNVGDRALIALGRAIFKGSRAALRPKRTALLERPGRALLSTLFGLASLVAVGCHDKALPGDTTVTQSQTSALSDPQVTVAAAAAGPNCTSAGDPTLGISSGFSCTGALAAATFTHAICACNAIQDSNSLTTDGFDSTTGAPNGGLGGDVAANTSISWSTTSSIGGTLWTPGNLGSSNASTV